MSERDDLAEQLYADPVPTEINPRIARKLMSEQVDDDSA